MTVTARDNGPAASPPPRILLVDDDVDLSAMLCDFLATEGFDVAAAHDGEAALAAVDASPPDAVILDVMLPGLTGFEVLRRIRTTSEVPVIMLTAVGDKTERVTGLDLGADDYVPKPCYPEELVARLRAVLRRRVAPQPPAGPALTLGPLRIDATDHRVTWAGREIELTLSEFLLLATLLEGRGVVSKDELSHKVLRRPRQSFDRSIDVHVSNLRQKLLQNDAGVAVETVRGVGYRIVLLP